MLKKLVSSSSTNDDEPAEKDASTDSEGQKVRSVSAKDSKDFRSMESKAPPVTSEPSAGELERLRDILFGSQTRLLETRLNDLEVDFEETRREMAATLNEKLEALSGSSSVKLETTQKELSGRFDAQVADHAAKLRSVQKELSERLDKIADEQSAQLRDVKKELSDNHEKLAADFLRQLRSVQKELNERIDKVNSELTERTRNLQSETRQRGDSLREEFLGLTASLENKKTSRQDLGQMLVELGLRLGNETEPS